jgi:hypothetical protein
MDLGCESLNATIDEETDEVEILELDLDEDEEVGIEEVSIWDRLNVTYKAYKLGRRTDAFIKEARWNSPMSGLQFSGLNCYASTLEMGEGEPTYTEQGVDGFIPKIHTCVALQASRYNSGDCWLRTSLIEDFYIHEDFENSADKIRLPSWATLDSLDGVTFAKGDILLRTMNSFYLLKAQECKRETYEDLGEV